MGYGISLLFTFLFITLGYIAHQLRNAFIIYQDAFLSHPNAVESNRLLGLAFQGQGQLDLAFEKFRLCPPDNIILPLLYNLALDYEMKGIIRGARMVYRYILKYDDNFRDVENRLMHLNRHYTYPQLNRKNKYLDLELCDHDNDKPLLGKYQLERKLGKGAMGVVYLAKDTKLHRLVAVKTLALSQEFEEEALAEATTRFFLEANAAGRLRHNNIISIYDAGEEQDLAYIAMEFFKGSNLVPYTKIDNLLPIAKVIDIVIHASEALDYAFQHGVVHRDIKPANIMYNPATEQMKLTDFGIARITDHYKTRTGEILGTPSYMSPEQLAGKAVDGRTDLFSLGVTLYQLLTGQLPFQARSMASLMFKIANETHTDIVTLRADIPDCLKTVVDKALQKEVKDRFQCGAEFAQALRDCGNEV
jgi:serine/threonine-protein kinase